MSPPSATAGPIGALDQVEGRRDAAPSDRVFLVVLVVVFGLAGVILRVLIFNSALGEVDSDEATGGLMALDLLRGNASTFVWGQRFGGTADVAVTALAFAVLGPSRFALRFAPFVESVLCAFLIWRIGLRLVTPRQAVLAALLFWVWPPRPVWFLSRQYLYSVPVMLFGLVVMLCAVRLSETPDRRRDWAFMGFAAGLGWWTSPTIAYFVVPTAAYLGWRLRAAVTRHLPVVTVAAVAGAAPWLWANLASGFSSLRRPPGWVQATPGARLGYFFAEGLPIQLGLRQFHTEGWVVTRPLAVILYAALVVALAAGVGLAVRRRAIDGIAVLCFPLVFAALPVAATDRYLVFLGAFVPLALARLLRSRALVAGTLAVAASLSFYGFLSVNDVPAGSMQAVTDVLTDRDRHHAFGGYWTAYRLMFESNERVLATSPELVRHSPTDAAVRAAPLPAYVFERGDPRADDFPDRAAAAGSGVEVIDAGRWVVFLPHKKVLPEDLHLW